MNRVGIIAVALVAVTAVAVGAQVSYPPGVSSDDLNAAIVAATPNPCGVPSPDTLNGTSGVSSTCMDRSDRARPTSVQASSATTDTSGNITVAFGRVALSANPVIQLIPVNTGTLPIVCNVKTRSATGFTAGCWQSSTTTLGGTLVTIAGTVVSPFNGGAPNVAVMWIAREPTQ